MHHLINFKVNPSISEKITVFKNKGIQNLIGWSGVLFLLLFLSIHTYKDMSSNVEEWYFHSTPVWLIVMIGASMIFMIKWYRLKNKGIDPKSIFNKLPEE